MRSLVLRQRCQGSLFVPTKRVQAATIARSTLAREHWKARLLGGLSLRIVRR